MVASPQYYLPTEQTGLKGNSTVTNDHVKAMEFSYPDYIPVEVGFLPATWMKYREALDGMVFGITGSPAGFTDFQHPLYLGAANNRGNIERFCPAAVDEFRIYTRALTKQEVNQNFQSRAAVGGFGKLPIPWGRLKTAR